MGEAYLHGFIPEEQQRLLDQANFLASKIYANVDFSGCSHLLEIGSGVGAQTQQLLNRWPEMRITCVDYSQVQLDQAQRNLHSAGDRVRFFCQNAKSLALEQEYDAVFICWTLEHIPEPIKVLESVKKYLKPGAKIWATEVFNSSYYLYPDLPDQRKYYAAYNQLQSDLGGNPDIGPQLGNILTRAGYRSISLNHNGFFLDQTKPEELRQMIDFWIILLKSGAPGLLEAGRVSFQDIIAMENDLKKVGIHENAVFFYQFVQAFAIN